MRKPARRFGFAEETLPVILFLIGLLTRQGYGFYSNHTVNLRVPRFVNNAHGAAAQLSQNFIAPKALLLAIIHRSGDQLFKAYEGVCRAENRRTPRPEYCYPGTDSPPSYRRVLQREQTRRTRKRACSTACPFSHSTVFRFIRT